MTVINVTKDDYLISTDKKLLQIAVIHTYLSEQSYWAKGIPQNIVERSIEHSIAFGVYHQAKQIGFCRVTSDLSTFAYLADVFILEEYRGKGLSKWLVSSVLSHPDLQNLRRWILATYDAHGLYAQYGFEPLDKPENFMQIRQVNPYGMG